MRWMQNESGRQMQFGLQPVRAASLLAGLLFLAAGHGLADEMQAPSTQSAAESAPPSTPLAGAVDGAGPKLEMRMPQADPASGKRPRAGGKRDQDARTCLEQASIAKIRACAEKYR